MDAPSNGEAYDARERQVPGNAPGEPEVQKHEWFVPLVSFPPPPGSLLRNGITVLVRLLIKFACLESCEIRVSAVKYDIGFASTDSGVSLTLSLSDSELVPQKVKTILQVDFV